jgi:DHA1 family multidrug resistance protein-like MFS transporter
MSFVYGLVYPFLSAYPIVLQGVCGMNLGAGGLVIGQLLAGLYILLIQGQYGEKLVANNNVLIPKYRLPPAMVGAVCFAGGMFLVS